MTTAAAVVALDPAAWAGELVALQRVSYAVEAELIGSTAIPPLRETPAELVAAGLTWWGCRDQAGLLGAVAVAVGGQDVDTDVDTDVERLVVAPRAFRRGVGSTLVRHVLAQAGGPVTVATGRANTPARTLYERLGFVLVDVVEVEPGLEMARYRHPG